MSDAARIIALFALAIIITIGFAVYRKVQALAGWLDVDTSTAWSLVWQGGVLITILAGATAKGMLKRVAPYAPAGLFVCIEPYLDYRAVAHINEFVLNSTPAWYGRSWPQFWILFVLIVAGYALSQYLDD